MRLFLLTHERELAKKTNTGVLVANVLADKALVVIWQRHKPCDILCEHIKKGSTALLYPSEDSLRYISQVHHRPLRPLPLSSPKLIYQNYIIIDSTWQQARKIYNKSPYLKVLPKVRIMAHKPSAFNLRRNQLEQGLCTAECAIELLHICSETHLANELKGVFDDFLLQAR